MACFLVTVAEAVVTTAVAKAVESKEKKAGVSKTNTEPDIKIPFSRKLKWLNNLLWGGSFLLAFEHVWSGEVVPWFPFLTATGNAADTSVMLHEMATSGVAMAALVTTVWAGMVLVSSIMEKQAHKEAVAQAEGGAV